MMTRGESAEMERRVTEVERELAQLPLWPVGGGSDAPTIITAIRGNDTIATVGAITIKGVKVNSLLEADAVTAVPSSDPTAVVVGDLPVGLGLGTLSGAAVYVAYWCKDQDSVTHRGRWASPLTDEAVVYSRATVSLPVTGDASTLVAVYLVDEAW